MDKLVSWVLGNVAANELAVHADWVAGYLEELHLLSCNLLKAALRLVDSSPLLVVGKATSEQIVGIKGRQSVVKYLKTESLTGQQVKLAFLKQIFVTTAETFFENAHGHKDAYWGIGSTHLGFFEQRLECFIFNLGCDQLEELVNWLCQAFSSVYFFLALLGRILLGVVKRLNCRFVFVLRNMTNCLIQNVNIRNLFQIDK